MERRLGGGFWFSGKGVRKNRGRPPRKLLTRSFLLDLSTKKVWQLGPVKMLSGIWPVKYIRAERGLHDDSYLRGAACKWCLDLNCEAEEFKKKGPGSSVTQDIR